MAKMFYTVAEAAERLGKTEDEVTQMATSGEIQEFRDREQLMFKVEQIDLLAGGGDEHLDEDSDIIGLADSTEEDAIELKEESVLGLADSKESTGTGVSIFEADDEGDVSDPSEVTHIADVPAPSEFSLDSGASGSGLLDLTKETDDTSLGLDTLEEMYPEDDGDMPASSSGLFESDGKADDMAAGVGAGAAIMPSSVIETYDGAGSGLAIGLAIGSLVCILLVATVLMSLSAGALPSIILAMKASYWIYVGAFGGGTILLGIIGMFIGKATG